MPLETQAAQVESILRPLAVDKGIKSSAWRAYFDATDPADFDAKFEPLGLPGETREALFRQRFGSRSILGSVPGFGPQPAAGKTDLPPGPTNQDLLRMGVEALPMATSIGASMFLSPGAGLATRALFAGLGAIPGTAAKQEIEARAGLPGAPTTAGDAVGGMLMGGAENAAAEFGGGLLGKMAGKLLGGPLRVAATAPENIAVKEANERWGLRLTPGQVAGGGPGGPAARLAEFVGETSLLGKPSIEVARAEGRGHAAKALDDTLILLSSPASPETVGRVGQDAIETGNRIFHTYAGQLYDQVDQLAQGAMVDMRPIKAEANRIIMQKLPAAAIYGVLGQPEKSTSTILNQIIGGPEQIPFSVAQQIRTKLMQIGPQMGELTPTEAKGISKHFVGELTGAMDTSATNLNPAAKTAWETARSFWTEGHDIFQRSLVASLMEKNPELLVKSIKPGAISDVKALKGAIIGYADSYGNAAEKRAAKDSWNQLREQFVRSSLLKDPDAIGVDAMDLFKLKDRMQQMGKPVMNELFGGDPAGREVLANVNAIGEAFSRVKKDLPFTRTYLMAEGVRLVVGSVAGTYSGSMMTGMGGAEAVPWIIAKIAYSPTATRYFLDGIAAFAPAAARAPTQTGTDALLRYAGPATGMLARAVVTGLKEYELLQQRKTVRVRPDGQRELPQVPGLVNPYR